MAKSELTVKLRIEKDLDHALNISISQLEFIEIEVPPLSKIITELYKIRKELEEKKEDLKIEKKLDNGSKIVFNTTWKGEKFRSLPPCQ